MKIFFDHQIFSRQRFGGISRYYTELTRQLASVDGVKPFILSPLCTNNYARKLTYRNRIGIPVPSINGTERYTRFFNEKVSNALIGCLKPNILHQTYYPRKISSRNRSVRLVTTVYDMIHELFPGAFPPIDETAAFKRQAVKNADLVICISETTRADLIRLTGIKRENTAVTLLGTDHIRQRTLPRPRETHKPYLLYVGLRGGYKNFDCLLRAYSTDQELLKNLNLVCFGGGELSPSEKSRIAEIGIPLKNVSWMNGDDVLLSAMYQHAAVFIYPSVYEGFGFPPLEAMTQGCPVVSSNAPSLMEVLGNAAEYFDPSSADELAVAIKTLLTSPQRVKQLRELGIRQAGLYTWRRCAEDTLKAYQQIC